MLVPGGGVRPAAPCVSSFRRGDALPDGLVGVSDAIAVLEHLFRGGRRPPCADAGDADDDGELTIADAVVLLFHLFAGAGPLPGPSPDCGPDPTADRLAECSTPGC